MVSIFLRYHALLQENREENEEWLWKVEECAQPKLMNLFGYKGELNVSAFRMWIFYHQPEWESRHFSVSSEEEERWTCFSQKIEQLLSHAKFLTRIVFSMWTLFRHQILSSLWYFKCIELHTLIETAEDQVCCTCYRPCPVTFSTVLYSSVLLVSW